MKLGFVSDFYYPSIGGTQMLCKGIAEWFLQQGHEIEIITSPDSNRKGLSYEVNELRGNSFKDSNILLEKNYDAVFVLADLFSPSITTMNPGDVRKSILILNMDENVYRWIKEGKIKDVAQRVEKIKSFSHVVSFCQDAPVNKFLDENGIKYHFIPNFSGDTLNGEKSEKITKEALGITKKIIFNHGRLHPNKNIHKMIEAFADSGLKDEYSLVILGAISSPDCVGYLNKCNDIIKSKGVGDSVRILKGTTNKIVINSLLSLADVYFLPSPSEGLPLVLIEAMSAGLPWVSTPVGGVPAVFGRHDNGAILSSINFTPDQMRKAIETVSGKNSRTDWEENYNIDKVAVSYSSLLETEEDLSETIEFLKGHKISFANQVYNEPEAIGNYLRSCLQFAGIVDEVYIIDHRSSDNTLEVIKSFEDQYSEAGIKFRWKTEPRDFSKDFTHGDLRTDAVYSCENEIVFNHDADFVFGSGFLKTMRDCIFALGSDSVYACSYEIPVVSGDLSMRNGVVDDFSWCNMHVHVPRVVKKSKAICEQKHVGGKYEWWYPKSVENAKWYQCSHYRNSILSIENKSEDRLELRRTMNTYFEDLASGKVAGKWLDNQNLRAETEPWSIDDRVQNRINNIRGDKYEF
ncbi:MAG: glycosyltransferase [Candidatus Hodarchaeales archaeon]|jgi:glycosyltransferase involved in cell wall biosynthesis